MQISPTEINLDELLQAKIIDDNTFNNIQDFYRTKAKQDFSHTSNQGLKNSLTSLIFAILGASLIGSGIILIFAHNWDNLPKIAKLILAFLPLVLAQMLNFYSIFYKKNQLWQEISATLVFFALGANIALVSQIYHLIGNFASFILCWNLLALLLIYLSSSFIVAIFYAILTLVFNLQTQFFNFNSFSLSIYWFVLLLLAFVPFYLTAKYKKSAFLSLNFLDYLLAINLILLVFSWIENYPKFYILGFASLFLSFYLVEKFNLQNVKSQKSSTRFFVLSKILQNSYAKVAFVGSLIILALTQNKYFWQNFVPKNFAWGDFLTSGDFWINIFLFGIAIVVFIGFIKNHKNNRFDVLLYLFIILALAILLNLVFNLWWFGLIAVNFYIVILAISMIKKGIEDLQFSKLNLGLAILSIWILVKFLDYDLSFILRGAIFIILGFAFFAINLFIIKNRKKYAN